jgi:deoxyadenosine/deoxycytidine kinase
VAPPRYIAIEGPIGVGKTTLARRLAQRLNGRTMLEGFEENPFLAGFYQDRARYAMKTQLFFLLERFDQQRREVLQTELFSKVLVSDYLFAKDRMFACLTLDAPELVLYERIYEAIAREVPPPDLVIYMTARLEVLLERIRHRGRHFEADFDAEYLDGVRQIYRRHFEYYTETPLLVLETSGIDLSAAESDHFERVLAIVREGFEGRLEYELPGSLC